MFPFAFLSLSAADWQLLYSTPPFLAHDAPHSFADRVSKEVWALTVILPVVCSGSRRYGSIRLLSTLTAHRTAVVLLGCQYVEPNGSWSNLNGQCSCYEALSSRSELHCDLLANP